MTQVSTDSPYWRLSSFYFFYCAILGVVFPYWGPYLESRDISAVQVGLVSSVFLGSNIVAANFWGWIGDRVSSRMALIRTGNVVPFFCFIYIPFTESFEMLVLLILVGSFCWQGLMPQFEVVAVEHTKSKPGSYGRARMWGSLGFVVASSLVGVLLDSMGYSVVPIAVACLFFVVWINTMVVPCSSHTHEKTVEVAPVVSLFSVGIMGLLIVNFFLHFSHGAYYSFYSLYLERAGFSGLETSVLWSVAVAAEVAMFYYLRSIFTKVTLKNFLLFCLALTFVRWLLIALFPDVLAMLLVAQTLHAFSFAGAHVCAMEYIRRLFGDQFHGRGQAVYSSLCVAAGSALGALLGGYMWEAKPEYVFFMASISVLIALCIGKLLLPALARINEV